jgi:UMF1 family MFS transporter
MMNIEQASRREKLAWAMYDFANSGYATVVLTTIYNAWFVSGIAMGNGFSSGGATLLWTVTLAVSNALILLSAPLVGAIADLYAIRKRLLTASTIGCVVFTALLSLPGPGDPWSAALLLVLSYLMFATGENLIAAFLPELTPAQNIGRLSGYGWSLGFLGGLSTLGLCLLYVTYAESAGQAAEQYIPVTMLIVAIFFALAAIPTLLWLRERGQPDLSADSNVLRNAFTRLARTLKHLDQFPDLRRFMFALTFFHAGIYIVIVLAAVYAEQVMGFDPQQNIILIAIVNITAAAGAFGFGHLQDRIGSIRTLMLTLSLWCVAILLAWSTQTEAMFWLAANLIGMALGASQSASRALVGLFSPPGCYGEFFGLWGLCVKFSAIIGPLSYGLINWLTHGDHRTSLLVTLVFFVIGLVIIAGINEKRGKDRALQGNE